MINSSMYQEDIIISNLYASNNIPLKYIKQITKLKDKSTNPQSKWSTLTHYSLWLIEQGYKISLRI